MASFYRSAPLDPSRRGTMVRSYKDRPLPLVRLPVSVRHYGSTQKTVTGTTGGGGTVKPRPTSGQLWPRIK